jgi:DNA repair protein RadB
MVRVSTGSADLNKWLNGGYDSDIITTLYGPGGSGKTNFCVLAAASAVLKGKKVIFIDTEGGFSVDRFKQICGSEEKLDHILLLKPTTFDEQWDAFGKLLKELKSNSVDFVVVDGMTMLYRLQIAEAEKDVNKIQKINGVLARQMRMLAEIARKRGIPVLITNQVYSNFGEQGSVNMVGGDILRYWSKCIIELKREGYKRKAILRKHRSIGEKELSFEIINEGIKKKGLF